MKITLLVLIGILFFVLFSISCNRADNDLSKREIFETYLEGMNTQNFEQVKQSLADSILITEMGYQVVRNMDAFRRHFLWDSVFRPDYTLVEFSENDSATIATVAKIDKRIRFLHDSALVYQLMLGVEDGHIVWMSTTQYLGMNGSKWLSRRDALTGWIDNHYPELSGFVNDLSPKGAQNYLQAMSLYNSEREKLYSSE